MPRTSGESGSWQVDKAAAAPPHAAAAFGGGIDPAALDLGSPAGEFVPILNGLKPGDKVVTDGSFYLRAEAARTRSGG